MPPQTAFNNTNSVDDDTMELIAKRVADYKKTQETSKQSSEDMDTHIDALSKVFELDKDDVEHIVRDVLIKKEQQADFRDKLYEGVIKYSKEVIISIVVVIVVAFLLLGRSSLQPSFSSSPSDDQETLADFSHFKRKAILANVLTSIAPLKVMLAEYYVDRGEYPKTLNEIGLSRNKIKSGKGINDLILAEKGSIVVKVDGLAGDNLMIMLFPKMTMGGMGFEWGCKTNFSGYLSGCEKIDGSQYLARFE